MIKQDSQQSIIFIRVTILTFSNCYVLSAIGAEDDDDDIMMGEEPDEEEEDKTVSLSDQKLIEERTSMLIAHFLFSIVWSIGGTLDGPSRLKFDEFFRSLCEMDTSGKYPR